MILNYSSDLRHHHQLSKLVPTLEGKTQWMLFRSIEYGLFAYFGRRVKFELNTDLEYKMARKIDWEFSSAKLVKDDIPKVEQFAEAHEDDMEMIFDIYSEDAIKVSITYSISQEGWCVTLTPQEENKYNSKISMVTWAQSPLDAFWMAAYKHVIVCERKEYPRASETQLWG